MHIKWHDINKVPSKWKCVPSRVTILSHIHITLRLSISKIISQANRVEHTQEAMDFHHKWILKWQDRLSSKQVVVHPPPSFIKEGVIHPPPASFSPLMIIPSSFLPSSFLSLSPSFFHLPSIPLFLLPSFHSYCLPWYLSLGFFKSRDWNKKLESKQLNLQVRPGSREISERQQGHRTRRKPSKWCVNELIITEGKGAPQSLQKLS